MLPGSLVSSARKAPLSHIGGQGNATIGMPRLSFALPTGWFGGPPAVDAGEAEKPGPESQAPATAIFPLDLLGGGGARNSGDGAPPAESQGAHAAANGHADGGAALSARRYTTPLRGDATSTATMELQVRQTALENTLSDSLVEIVHLQEQIAVLQNKLQVAHSHIEEHVTREQMMTTTIEAFEGMMAKMQKELEERLDVEELVGYRSYAQKREKEVKSRLDMLQDENDRKDVIIKEQAVQIAWLKNELELRTADLDVAIDDLKTSAHREWKKHRSVCMEIAGVYIDFNHQEDVGLVMDRSAKYGPDELGMVGVGLKLTNVAPFEVLGVHPDARTHDGLPVIFHEGDVVVAVEDVNLDGLNRADISGLLIGPPGTTVHIKVLRYESGLGSSKTSNHADCQCRASTSLRKRACAFDQPRSAGGRAPERRSGDPPRSAGGPCRCTMCKLGVVKGVVVLRTTTLTRVTLFVCHALIIRMMWCFGGFA